MNLTEGGIYIPAFQCFFGDTTREIVSTLRDLFEGREYIPAFGKLSGENYAPGSGLIFFLNYSIITKIE